MMSLRGKKIILAISGSIAAYKAAFLCRLLIKDGAEVQVVMTEAATKFISALTLSTLSKNEVHIDVMNDNSWNNHVELGLWADLMVIAPTTANTISKMASGQSDNMLLAVYLSSKCPVMFAPAMDLDMWKHPSTKKNLQTLKEYGNILLDVESGELASGLVGDGRMAEPINILRYIKEHFSSQQKLSGKKVMITAGPTHEALDPVRFIGNKSSGKMGTALAEVLYEMGAEVDLILGPTNVKPIHDAIKIHHVKSAQDMYEKATELFPNVDAAIMAAAVADYRPANYSDIKIKKKSDDMNLELERTKDIAAALGANKENQILIGFALETNNEAENAQRKLKKKNFDFIVLNSMKDKGATFGHDTNKITIFKNSGEELKFDLKSKKDVAKDIAEVLLKYLKQ